MPSTLLLYGSTALFMASLLGHVTSIDRLVARARAGLFSSDAYTDADLDAFEDDVMRHSWMMTIALGINVRRISHPSANFLKTATEGGMAPYSCLAAGWGQHRVVARVRGVEEPGRVLSRPSAHRADILCVMRVVSRHKST